MHHNQQVNPPMSVTDQALIDEAREWLRDAGDGAPTTKASLARAAKELGISFNRAWAIYYGRVERLWAVEYLSMKACAEAGKARRIARLKAEIARLETMDAAITARLDTEALPSLGAVADQPAASEAGEGATALTPHGGNR
jgi:molybdenum-dependent DNA-binding transcriptional regulator ModE